MAKPGTAGRVCGQEKSRFPRNILIKQDGTLATHLVNELNGGRRPFHLIPSARGVEKKPHIASFPSFRYYAGFPLGLRQNNDRLYLPIALIASSTMNRIGSIIVSCLLSSGTWAFVPRVSISTHPSRNFKLRVFLDECQLRSDAWEWAKETSKTNRARPAVVAIYNEDLACVHVGMHMDSALAVGALVRKHGRSTVAALREEPFPPEVTQEPFGLKMMEGLVASWLEDVTSGQPEAPVGNTDESWAAFDAKVSPFLIGAFGDGIDEEERPKDASEMTEEELLDMRRQVLACPKFDNGIYRTFFFFYLQQHQPPDRCFPLSLPILRICSNL